MLVDVDFRVDADFFAADDFLRGLAFVADAFARELDVAVLDFRADDEDFLRLLVADDPRSFSRFVRPARTVVAFSSCATPFATSSCARATALSTAVPPPERFDRLFFLAAILRFSRA